MAEFNLFLSQALQLFAELVSVSQVRRVGYFPACSSSGQGLWIINTANYKPDNYPSPMFMVMTWLVWIMTWLVHYMPTQLERTNKMAMLGVTIIQVTNNCHSCKYCIFIKHGKYLRMFKISSSRDTRVPHCHNCLRFNFMLQFVACCHQSASDPTETQLLNQLSMLLSVFLTHSSYNLYSTFTHYCNDFIHFLFILSVCPFFVRSYNHFLLPLWTRQDTLS